jgi:exopolyphosphatase/guanosine-5'-triphosphate,3'-diphosphate pyrophosphatase
MRKVLRRRETLHLGAIVEQTGGLTPEAEQDALRAARRLRRAADRTSPRVVIAAATHALREAANGDDLLARLEAESRTSIRILDGSTEARLVYEGVRSALNVGDEPMMVSDLGGGSLELAAGVGDNIEWDASYPLGASLLTARLATDDPMTHAQHDAIAEQARGHLAPLVAKLDGASRLPCFATGGTARALARLELSRWGMRAGPDGMMPKGVLIPAGSSSPGCRPGASTRCRPAPSCSQRCAKRSTLVGSSSPSGACARV